MKRSKKDIRDDIARNTAGASVALVSWLESQGIEPIDSVPVLALTMAAMLKACAKQYGKDRTKLTGTAIMMIETIVEKMGE